MKITLIAWTQYHRRSELLAQHLKATIHYIYYGQTGQLLQAPIRYLVQAWRTWKILRQEQPDIIFVQNPPIFAVLIVFFYAWCYGAQYAIDSHTGAFLSSKWGWSVELHRMLSRNAFLTIVHNKSQENIVKSWDCPYLVIAYTPGEYPSGEPYLLSDKFNIAVICSFNVDEPLEILFEAANQLADVNFYLTGNSRHLNPLLLAKKPENIFLTGYLPYERYVGLLRGVGTIIDLVNKDHTLLMGAFEAVSLGVPLIVSDWPLLRDYFYLGTVYVQNTVEGICDGVRRTQLNHVQLQHDILLLREQLQLEWIQESIEIQNLLNEVKKENI